MSPTLGPYDLPGAYTGDAVDMMREIPDGSIHCCITSPPYWGLRSYLDPGDPDKAREIGAEATPDQYVASMVRVFREVRRVLRPDGTCWLNLGDSYVGNASPGGEGSRTSDGGRPNANKPISATKRGKGLKPKDLCLIPYRVALALQADGWWLRSNIVWAKGLSFCEHYSGSVMPEGVRDRPTSAHEAVFLLTKSARYWYDAEAVQEAWRDDRAGDPGAAQTKHTDRRADGSGRYNHDTRPARPGRNLRNVWAISPRPYSGSHYAVFPPQLIAPMIDAGCPRKACAECGSPWVRHVERGNYIGRHYCDQGNASATMRKDPAVHGGRVGTRATITTGWAPLCSCGADASAGIVLDPFMGSGTTGQVAEDRGRLWIGFDLDERNATLIRKRTAQTSLLGLVGQ